MIHLHIAADSLCPLHSNFFWWAPENDFFCQSAFWPSKVILVWIESQYATSY